MSETSKTLFFLIIISLILPGFAEVEEGLQEDRKTAHELFMETNRGNQTFRIKNREKAMLPLILRASNINIWYQKFWEGTGINVPDNARFRFIEDPAHSEAITLLFELTPDAKEKDKKLVMHRNIVRMLRNEVLKTYDLPDDLHLFAAVYIHDDEEFTDVESYTGLQYLYPDLLRNPEADLPERTGSGNQRVTITGVEYAIELLHPIVRNLERQYASILQMHALLWQQDADLELIPHQYDINALMLKFNLGTKARNSDPDLRRHRNVGQSFSEILYGSISEKPDWLSVGAAADTTNGQRTPVLLR